MFRGFCSSFLKLESSIQSYVIHAIQILNLDGQQDGLFASCFESQCIRIGSLCLGQAFLPLPSVELSPLWKDTVSLGRGSCRFR